MQGWRYVVSMLDVKMLEMVFVGFAYLGKTSTGKAYEIATDIEIVRKYYKLRIKANKSAVFGRNVKYLTRVEMDFMDLPPLPT